MEAGSTTAGIDLEAIGIDFEVAGIKATDLIRAFVADYFDSITALAPRCCNLWNLKSLSMEFQVLADSNCLS